MRILREVKSGSQKASDSEYQKRADTGRCSAAGERKIKVDEK